MDLFNQVHNTGVPDVRFIKMAYQRFFPQQGISYAILDAELCIHSWVVPDFKLTAGYIIDIWYQPEVNFGNIFRRKMMLFHQAKKSVCAGYRPAAAGVNFKRNLIKLKCFSQSRRDRSIVVESRLTSLFLKQNFFLSPTRIG